jgi:hypothetical protein
LQLPIDQEVAIPKYAHPESAGDTRNPWALSVLPRNVEFAQFSVRLSKDIDVPGDSPAQSSLANSDQDADAVETPANALRASASRAVKPRALNRFTIPPHASQVLTPWPAELTVAAPGAGSAPYRGASISGFQGAPAACTANVAAGGSR